MSLLTKSILGFAAGALVACSSGPKRVEYPESANPQAEIKRVEQKVSQAKAQQADVLAHDEYEDSVGYLKKAKEEAGEGSKPDAIFKPLGKAEANIDRAIELGNQRQGKLENILAARQAALGAGANETDEKVLNKTDKDFYEMAEDLGDGDTISSDDLDKMQRRYLDIEVNAVKNHRLAETRNLIESAERMKAARLSPKSLDAARAKLKNAEAVIEVDRRNDAQISAAVNEALVEAENLVAVTETAAQASGQSPEEIALEIERRKANAATLDAKLTATKMTAEEQALALGQAERQKRSLQGENSALENEKQFNDAFEKARQQIPASEAEVYRQGNNLLIRLKGMRFTSGSAELPSASIATLTKVKDIIGEMNAKEVTIEGHTDSVGTAEVNHKISEERADAVAKYFVADQSLSEDQVKAVGYGFDKPITSNKTKEGRAQNRRVDVIISR